MNRSTLLTVAVIVLGLAWCSLVLGQTAPPVSALDQAKKLYSAKQYAAPADAPTVTHQPLSE